MNVRRSALLRTARKLMRGEVFVPGRVWSGHERASHLPARLRRSRADAAPDLASARAARLTAWDLLVRRCRERACRACRTTADVRAARARRRGCRCGPDRQRSHGRAGSSRRRAPSAPHLKPAAYFLDLNSARPAAKQQAADVIDAAGGRYRRGRHHVADRARSASRRRCCSAARTPRDFLPLAQELGFTGAQRVLGSGRPRRRRPRCAAASMIKGIEALLTESLLAARHYGVERTVLDSLQSTCCRCDDWQRPARYMISRSLMHGRRRAEEMREVARTVAEAGSARRI